MGLPSVHRKVKFLFNSKLLLIIDLAQTFLFIIFYVPLISRLLEYAMQFAHLSYLTEKNLSTFLLSPSAAILMLFLFLTIPMLLLSRITSLIYYCHNSGILRRPYLLRITAFGAVKTLQSLRKRNFGLLLYTLPFYLLTNLPLLIGLIFHTDLGKWNGTRMELYLKGSCLVLLLTLSALALRGIFTIHTCILGKLSFREGHAMSFQLVKGRFGTTALRYLRLNAFLTAGYFIMYYLLLLLTALFVFLLTNKTLAVTIFLSAYSKISLYATIFYSIYAFIMNVNLVSTLYYTYQEESLLKITHKQTMFPRKVAAFNKRHKSLINALLIVILSLMLLNFFVMIHNDSLYLSEALSGIQISSHRGNSAIAPENTIPALENAIAVSSDYAEIDVQETKDGVLVLLHDKSLLRTAGVNRNIWEMTYAEISELDVGSWFHESYRETKIPSLEEVLTFCKGKIKLNIEVKSFYESPDLEETLVALIEQYDFVDQCIISSTDYDILVRIKKLNENIKTGYILSAVYGNFSEKEYVDFFSIRSSFITKNVVERAHEAGKEIHAWTVNSRRELERMKTLKVDCVITNYPSLAREVLYKDDTSASFLQLINRMFRYRSLYRLNY